MKRWLAMLCVCLLLLCGCQGAEAPAEEENLITHQGPHDCTIHSNDSIAARRVAICGDQIYFGCNCSGEEQILTMPGASPSRISVALEGGRILRRCGSVLLAERGEQLLALETESETSEWQVLMSYSPGKGFLPKGFQRGEEWLLLPDSERSELLCVDLKEMTAAIRPSAGYLVDLVRQGDRLYYIKEQEGGYTLYTSDLYFRGVRELASTAHPNLSVSGERIACYGGEGYPAIYDLQAERVQPLKVGYSASASAAGGGVLTVRYWESEADQANGIGTKLYAVDIATGEELPAAEYRRIVVSAEGEVAFFSEQKKCRFGAADEVDPQQVTFEHFAVGDRYIACNKSGTLTVIHRQRNTAFYFDHR
ncbi:MAG: hypothetical protein IJN82_01755 [Clostridia bacterium]|nr:hypothetical protein [Clostridia bacterium]MBQ7089821.1 hypothetical protein [Clostridia bacterium]